jgi:hypothetical protein
MASLAPVEAPEGTAARPSTPHEGDIGFEGGVAAGIEDFAGADGCDLEHGFLLGLLFKVLGPARGAAV